MADIHPQKIKKAVGRLEKGLEACAEARLILRQVPCAELKQGDYVVVNGRLDHIVATQPGQVGVVALEKQGQIVQLPPEPYLVLRPM